MECVRVPVSGGRTMHVTIVGPAVGRPAVALHGLGGSTEQNLPALEAVATHYGLRIHAIDLPNHGRSGKVRILHFQVRHFADLILEAIRALEIEPVIIFGHSFGGQLAALVAEDIGTGALQPVFVNPALGTPWDLKLRLCWRRPWLFGPDCMAHRRSDIQLGCVEHPQRATRKSALNGYGAPVSVWVCDVYMTIDAEQVRAPRADAERNRRKILDAAASVFAERGVTATLNEVALAAGVGVGTVYRKFPDKEAVFDALFDVKIDNVVRLAVEASRVQEPGPAFRGFLLGVIEARATDRGLGVVVMHSVTRPCANARRSGSDAQPTSVGPDWSLLGGNSGVAEVDRAAVAAGRPAMQVGPLTES